MGFWPFSKNKKVPPPGGKGGEPAPPSAAPVVAPSGLPKEIARLVTVGEPGGAPVEEALATLRELRVSPDEGLALDELFRRHRTRALPDPVAVAVAAALVDRGELSDALSLLEGSSSTEGLLMRADLLADRGDVGPALALAERVLLRDFDQPGVRERHRRWRQLLGFDADVKRPDAAATVAAREPDSPFLLLREVARGGAGAVYESEDRELGRRVALKVYHQPERDRAQLSHEARVAVALRGPGVARVFDVDPEHGWIALEWAALGSLRERIKRRDLAMLLPIERWLVPLAQTLARLHAAGWMHHDVKPANVILRTADDPVFTDFGIARRIGEPSPAGSFGYMSPERMAGRASDPRDDVFGFGRLLEDVLDIVIDRTTAARWRPIAAACVGPDGARPSDGRALLTRVRVEAVG